VAAAGKPGANGEGFALVTASARNRPDLTCGHTGPEVVKTVTHEEVSAEDLGGAIAHGLNQSVGSDCQYSLIRAAEVCILRDVSKEVGEP
jgi:hypothetical protein